MEQPQTSRPRGRTLALVLGILLSLGISITPANAADNVAYLSIERFTLGQGYVLEPVEVPVTSGLTAAQMLAQTLTSEGIQYTNIGSVASNFYLVALKDDAGSATADIPDYITERIEDYWDEDVEGRASPDWLGQGDYFFMSGWMWVANNEMGQVGMSDYEVQAGDVVRLMFSVTDYGSDLGVEGAWSPNLITQANKDALTKAVAAINSAADKAAQLAQSGMQDAYDNAIAVLSDIESSQAGVDAALAQLTSQSPEPGDPGSGTPEPELPGTPPSSDDVMSLLERVAAYENNALTVGGGPAFGAEWVVMGLARGGFLSEADKALYLESLEQHLVETDGVLSTNRYTEYSRVILAVTALGVDARNVAGYDLTAPLGCQSKVTLQGINGAVWALLALDTAQYPVATCVDSSDQTTRSSLIADILSRELPGGGWALSGSGEDPDITGMALQALAPYKDQPDVAAAIDRALSTLSDWQLPDGGFRAAGFGPFVGDPSAESAAQVLVALNGLGIPVDDARFVKNGLIVYDALAAYRVDLNNGQTAFSHNAGGPANGMSTEQGLYALVSAYRELVGQSHLYDMTDVSLVSPTTPGSPTGPGNTVAVNTGGYAVAASPSALLAELSLLLLASGAVGLGVARRRRVETSAV
ncbi:MAG: hypothetical protein LBN10_06235 [Propionibacteriaceae bacterium]|jgi:hypothetical protein|nr:hypothetical protein [Propionibacteriaceae bacterium]